MTSEIRSEMNKTKTITIALVVVIGLGFMSTKFFELYEVTNESFTASAKFREIQKISPIHEKYIG
jgi:hypothetical protein